MNSGKLAAICIIMVLAACAPQPVSTGWGNVKTPKTGPAKVYGGYSAGCLQGAEKLQEEAKNYKIMRPERIRNFAHPSMVRYVNNLAAKTHAIGGQLLVGDVAQPRGGPMSSGHGSHQTGLDADFWYSADGNYKKRVSSNSERENAMPTELANTTTAKLNGSVWNSYYVRLLEAASQPDSVDRIFVHPAIKQKLCETEQGKGWLYKLRPWWGHQDHFHVRLKCPAGDDKCKAQEQSSRMDGCDDTLAWWFSDEALSEFSRRQEEKKEKAPIVLPEECTVVLEGIK